QAGANAHTAGLSIPSIQRTGDTGPSWAWAAVQLPDGAVVTQLAASVYDESAVTDIKVALNRTPFDTPSSYISMATATSSGAPFYQTIATATITIPQIDHSAHFYYITIDFGTADTFHSVYAVRITYGIETPLP